MQILTYPVGVVVGLIPVVVELGAPPRPASLRLDGRPVCRVTAAAPGCAVDLGPAPRVHVLELVREDAEGHVVERAVRWVNRPGASEAEVQTRTHCEERSSRCTVRVGWAHPDREDPKKVVVAIDGRPVAVPKKRDVSFDIVATRGAVLTVDLVFPDKRRATRASVLGGRMRGDEESSLVSAVDESACGPAGPGEALAQREKAGDPVRSAERGDGVLVFVVEPAAYGALVELLGSRFAFDRSEERAALDRILKNASFTSHLVVAGSGLWHGELSRKDPPALDSVLETLDAAVLRPVRVADGIAAGAFFAGTPGLRRLVVAILAEGAADESTLDAAAVRAYVGEIGVPLAVWRLRDAKRPEWPDGPRVRSLADFRAELLAARDRLDCQAVVWSEGR